MVAADDDRRADSSLAHEPIEEKPRAVALAIAEPADPRRKSLERDALLGQAQPAGERLVVREELLERVIGDPDVLGIARQRGPTERAPALAELRT